MINKHCDINGIAVYVDPYMEDDKVLKGRKTGTGTIFMIANPKTASIMYTKYKQSLRKNKLERILKNS